MHLDSFENNSGLSIESNWLTHPWKMRPKIEILGDYGSAEIPLRIYTDQGNQVFERTPKITEPGNHFFEVLKDFVDAVREDREPKLSLESAILTHQVCLAADLSAKRGSPVQLSELKG